MTTKTSKLDTFTRTPIFSGLAVADVVQDLSLRLNSAKNIKDKKPRDTAIIEIIHGIDKLTMTLRGYPVSDTDG